MWLTPTTTFSDINTRHHHYPVLSLRNSTQMHTGKAAQSTRQTNTRSFVSFESRKTEQTPASPFGTVPAVVAVAGVGGSTLIIPQNPSQMSQSLEGRWAGPPPPPHRDDAGSSSDLLGITFNSHAFPGTVGWGAAICLACCGVKRERESERKWEEEGEWKCICLYESCGGILDDWAAQEPPHRILFWWSISRPTHIYTHIYKIPELECVHKILLTQCLLMLMFNQDRTCWHTKQFPN